MPELPHPFENDDEEAAATALAQFQANFTRAGTKQAQDEAVARQMRFLEHERAKRTRGRYMETRLAEMAEPGDERTDAEEARLRRLTDDELLLEWRACAENTPECDLIAGEMERRGIDA